MSRIFLSYYSLDDVDPPRLAASNDKHLSASLAAADNGGVGISAKSPWRAMSTVERGKQQAADAFIQRSVGVPARAMRSVRAAAELYGYEGT